MALIISDGFSNYKDVAGAKMMKNWSFSASAMSFLNAGRWGTGSYSIRAFSTSGFATQTLTLGGSTTIVGLAIKPETALNNYFLSFTNGTNTVAVKVNASNQIVVYNGSTTTYHTVTSPIAINTAWYYLELKVVWSATVGQIILRLDGSEYYDSGATLNLGASTNTSSVTIGNTTANASCYMTDFMLMDATGTTFNNFQGGVRIESLGPSGDGAHQAWSLPNNTLLTSANQSRMTTNTSGWTSTGTVTLLQNTFAPDPRMIANSLYIYGQTSGWTVISTPNGTSGYPVTPGQSLGLGCWMNVSSSYTVSVSLRFYDGAGAQVGLDLVAINGNTNSAWTFLAASAITVPAGAATCSIVFKSPNWNFTFYMTGVVLSTNAAPATYVEPGNLHYVGVGELTADSDSTYVATNTVNAKETYPLSDLQSTTGNILAVRPFAVARKENAATQTLATITRVGVTDYNGTTQTLPNNLTYQQQNDLYTVNPVTSAAWTRSEVNSLEAGVELKS